MASHTSSRPISGIAFPAHCYGRGNFLARGWIRNYLSSPALYETSLIYGQDDTGCLLRTYVLAISTKKMPRPVLY